MAVARVLKSRHTGSSYICIFIRMGGVVWMESVESLSPVILRLNREDAALLSIEGEQDRVVQHILYKYGIDPIAIAASLGRVSLSPLIQGDLTVVEVEVDKASFPENLPLQKTTVHDLILRKDESLVLDTYLSELLSQSHTASKSKSKSVSV